MSKQPQTTSLRMHEETREFLKANFDGIQTGFNLIVEPFDKLRKTVMHELKGHFSKEEIVALVDSQNGVLLTPSTIHNKSFFLAEIEDFELLEDGISRHGADCAALVDKIEKLSQSQVYFLLMDIHIFWNTNGDLEDYILKMI